jgi:ABC-2 type transport system ATP-binding protein
MNSIIEIDQLTKRFRKFAAVDRLSLQVPEGAVMAFLGPNGSGKTTTIKCMLNLLTADEGTARVLGCESGKLGPAQFQRIGYVSENQKLPEWMTVAQLLDYVRPMYPDWDRDFERRMHKEFELPSGTRLSALSRGQKMKAALLSSLAYRPKLVVLDEPFSGLDALVRDEFLHGLLELTETEGWSVFISSHDIEEVQRLADRVAIINKGSIQLDESSEALLERFRTVEVVLEQEATLPAGLPDAWINVRAAGRSIRYVDTTFAPDEQLALIRRHFPAAVRHDANPMTLREIFVALARTYRLSAQPEPQPA